MAAGDIIADDQHVVRHCSSSKVVEGVVQSTAFMLRAGEAMLSVNWAECSSEAADRVGQCRDIRGALMNSNRAVRPNDHFVVSRVGAVTAISELAGTAMALSAIHDPLSANVGHSGIRGLPEAGTALAALSAAALAATVNEAPIRCGDL